MLRDILKRVGILIPWMGLILTLNFFMVRLSPGSPFAGSLEDSSEKISMTRNAQKAQLDKPIFLQYIEYCQECWRTKSLGRSLLDKHRTFTQLLTNNRAWLKTLEIILFSFILGTISAIGLGIFCAVFPNSEAAMGIHFCLSLIAACPSYLLYPFLVRLLVVKFKLFTTGGWGENLFGDWRHLGLPVLILSMKATARLTRFVEDSLQEVLLSPYIRTAIAKGLPFHKILFFHALKPALIPLSYIFMLSLTAGLVQSVYLEPCFSIAGIGYAYNQVRDQKDFNLILAMTLFFFLLNQLILLTADLLQKVGDPRQHNQH